MDGTTDSLCCKRRNPGHIVVRESLTRNIEVSFDRFVGAMNCQGCRIKTVLDFIETSPIEAVTLESASAVLRISPSRFRHLFKDYVGVSFHKYVISLRLERARHLLRTTSYTVERIAGMLGIQDLSHFARDFKRAYGISPGATRCVVANELIARSSQNGHL
jgi:transcriptional regulator GlxA family with amidase domain